MNSPILSTKNLSKTYLKNNLQVLSEINISVKKGEFVSVIGPSGCGKSTFFNILSGVEEQSNGQIEFNGKIMKKRTGKFGYMPQSPLLLPWRTVLQNVMLGLDIQGNPKEKSENQASKILSEFGLSKFADFYPEKLSGGMKQRVALLRTILFQKDLLLLDEPFGALDALTRLECQNWLLTLRTKLKPTILFITHDVREAIFLSDKIYVFSKRPGKITASFSVQLPYPRQYQHLSKPEAINLEKEILSCLMGENKL